MLLQKYRTYGKELVKSKQAFVEEIEDELESIDDNFTRMLKSFQKDIDGVRKKASEFCIKLTALFRRETYDLNVRFYIDKKNWNVYQNAFWMQKTFGGIENDYTRKLSALWDQGHADVRAKDVRSIGST